MGWGTPAGTNRLSHQPGVLSPPWVLAWGQTPGHAGDPNGHTPTHKASPPHQEGGSLVPGLLPGRDNLPAATTVQALTKEIIPGQGVEDAGCPNEVAHGRGEGGSIDAHGDQGREDTDVTQEAVVFLQEDPGEGHGHTGTCLGSGQHALAPGTPWRGDGWPYLSQVAHMRKASRL